MSYILHTVALAALAFWAWMFQARPGNPEMGFGQFMLILAVTGGLSMVLSLLALRRLSKDSRVAYFWISALVALSGLALLAGLAMDYSGGSGGADIGGMIMIFFGIWSLVITEVLALIWTIGTGLLRVGHARRKVHA
ncbi:hypothetical protein GCM10009596_01950 [Arthrobacter rhombi]|uniref:hypothetical protein n=1 Tax=Arthrobacter rhombi TaxID=71253 RepID=UPI0031CDE549